MAKHRASRVFFGGSRCKRQMVDLCQLIGFWSSGSLKHLLLYLCFSSSAGMNSARPFSLNSWFLRTVVLLGFLKRENFGVFVSDPGSCLPAKVDRILKRDVFVDDSIFKLINLEICFVFLNFVIFVKRKL